MAEKAKRNKQPVNRTITFGSRIWLAGEKKFFGPGTSQLLSLVDKKRAINAARAEMKLSHFKANNMVKTMEQELGFKIFKTTHGRADGVSAILTDEGKELVTCYETLKAECAGFIKESYDRNFSEFLKTHINQ